MADTSFKTYTTPDGQVYEIDNIPVSKDEFESRRALSKQEMQDFRTAPTSGAEDLEDFAAAAKARARQKNLARKHGGGVKIPKTKVSTGQTKSKKSSNW